MAGLISSETHGVLVVDKPSGPTSHDIVARVRKHYGTRHVGHAGTLDPMASGVLVVLVGEACKLASYLTLANKLYRASVSFGVATDSLDADGERVAEAVLAPGWLDAARLEAALAHERARSEQVPPAVSAIQIGGVRAHRSARSGAPLCLPPRPVKVHGLSVLRWSDSELQLELGVSKGYYVRALARDLGEALGVPAHLNALRRLASGPFSLAESTAWPLDASPHLLDLAAAARRSLPSTHLTAEGERRARLGQRLAPSDFTEPVEPEGVSAWLSVDERLVALGAPADGASYRVVRGFRA